MRTRVGAAGFVTASLVLAPAALASTGGDAGKARVSSEQVELPVVKLNPTGRTYEIEVPLKLDGARLKSYRLVFSSNLNHSPANASLSVLSR